MQTKVILTFSYDVRNCMKLLLKVINYELTNNKN